MSPRFHLFGRVATLAAANALQALLAVGLFLLATRVLEAADFGLYALLMSVVALAVAISDGGGALALPAHYGPADHETRGRMVATFLAVSVTVGSLTAVLLVAAWPWLGVFVEASGKAVPWDIILACAVLVPLRAIAASATTVLSVSGRGGAIAALIAVQALVTFLGSLAGLFVVQFGILSLFLGAVLGQLAGFAVAAYMLRTEALRRPSRQWLRVAATFAPTAALAGLIDGLRVFSENALIARAASLQAVGYYAHARLYQSLLLASSNAVAHNVWSISLAEAHARDRRFLRTGRVWEAMHLAVVLAGLAAVLIGDEVIALLTNDVLTPAAAYLPWLIATLLIQLSGRAATATLFAAGCGAQVTQVRTVIAVIALAGLPFFMAEFQGIGLGLGIPGLIGVVFAEALAYRFYLRSRARTFGVLPFQDFWVVVGVVGIVVLAAVKPIWPLGPSARFAVFLVAASVALAVDWWRDGPTRALQSLRHARSESPVGTAGSADLDLVDSIAEGSRKPK